MLIIIFSLTCVFSREYLRNITLNTFKLSQNVKSFYCIDLSKWITNPIVWPMWVNVQYCSSHICSTGWLGPATSWTQTDRPKDSQEERIVTDLGIFKPTLCKNVKQATDDDELKWCAVLCPTSQNKVHKGQPMIKMYWKTKYTCKSESILHSFWLVELRWNRLHLSRRYCYFLAGTCYSGTSELGTEVKIISINFYIKFQHVLTQYRVNADPYEQ